MACVIAGSAALPELSDACTRAVYLGPDDNRPVMGLSIWTQYDAGNKVMKLTLTNGAIYSGDAAGEMRDSKPLMFLFGV